MWAYRFAGDRFVERVLPDDVANRENLPPFFRDVVGGSHSVVTVHLVGEAV